MFICEFDGKAIGPGKKLNKVVVEVRNRKYQYQKRKKILLEEEDTYTHPSKESFEFHTATGWEIVKEVNACDDCAKKHGHTHYDSMI